MGNRVSISISMKNTFLGHPVCLLRHLLIQLAQPLPTRWHNDECHPGCCIIEQYLGYQPIITEHSLFKLPSTEHIVKLTETLNYSQTIPMTNNQIFCLMSMLGWLNGRLWSLGPWSKTTLPFVWDKVSFRGGWNLSRCFIHPFFGFLDQEIEFYGQNSWTLSFST